MTVETPIQRPDRTRRIAIVAVAAVAVIAVSAIVVTAIMSRDEQRRFTLSDADRIAADVGSRDPARAAAAIALPPGQQIDAAALPALARLELQMDPTTFRTDEDGLVTVTGTVAREGGAASPAVFYLAYIDGEWMVADVVPQALLPATAPLARSAPPAAPLVAARRVPAECSSPAGTPVPETITDGRRSVVLVHGWNGGPESMSSLGGAIEERLGDQLRVFSFDYSDDHELWAGQQEISGCLAAYLDEISQASIKGGGDGKVFVVGHSMGGLAARYASALTVDERLVGDAIAGLITVDTPHRGSYWGGEIWPHLLDWTVNEWARSLWGEPLGEYAGRCLAHHDGAASFPNECGSAPGYLPDGVPVHQIAGSVRVTRTFWGVPLYTFSLDGDSVVDTYSQHGYLGSGPTGSPRTPVTSTTVSCTVTTGGILESAALALRTRGIGPVVKGLVETFVDGAAMADITAGRVSLALVPVLIFVNGEADCSHARITEHDEVASAAVTTLSRWIATLPDQRPTWLYERLTSSSAIGPSGVQRSFTLDGEVSATSTGFWVGCEGQPAVAVFDLGGQFRKLSGIFTLDSHAPSDLLVRVTLSLDGTVADEWEFRLGDRHPVTIDTTGAQTLRLEAIRLEGVCTAASIGYGVAFNTGLTR